MSRADEITERFLKYGAAFERAMMRAGYNELSAPDVVAIIEYMACTAFSRCKELVIRRYDNLP